MYDFLKGSENLKASDELRSSVRRKIAASRRRSRLRSAIAAVGSVAAAFVICMNVSEDMALAASRIPVLSNLVSVVTAGRYNIEIGGSSANIDVPQFEGLTDKEMAKELNEKLGKDAAQLAAQFEADARELSEMSDGQGHMGVESSYIIRTDNDDYIVVDMYVLNIAGSSSTTHKFYTIDKKTGKIIKLSELFVPGADYVGRLSDIIRKEMLRQNAEEEGMFFVEPDEFGDGFTGISPEQNFFINDKGNLVICFDKYEVAAGAQGCPEFEIDPADIADIRK